MHRFKRLSFFVIVPLAAACAQGATLEGIGGSGRGGGTPVDTGGAAGTGGTSASSSSGQASSSGNSGNAPTTCTKAGGYEGCCIGTTSYYCSKGSTTVTEKACPSGQTCGWSSSKGYYACVAPPAEADPEGQYPIACQ
jgi:hypothetical protein